MSFKSEIGVKVFDIMQCFIEQIMRSYFITIWMKYCRSTCGEAGLYYTRFHTVMLPPRPTEWRATSRIGAYHSTAGTSQVPLGTCSTRASTCSNSTTNSPPLSSLPFFPFPFTRSLLSRTSSLPLPAQRCHARCRRFSRLDFSPRRAATFIMVVRKCTICDRRFKKTEHFKRHERSRQYPPS